VISCCNRFYYPACDKDAKPVIYTKGYCHSFVYVDYRVSRERLDSALKYPGFLGYDKLGQRNVSARELVPHGWIPTLPNPEDGNPEKYKDWIETKPFCQWVVFERQPGRQANHGPQRFSLLDLCADGVAAYQALYVANKLKPEFLAIIQPGTGFGGNWTNFNDEKKILARTVLGNPAGRPDYLVSDHPESPRPTHYREQVPEPKKTSRLSLWKLALLEENKLRL